MEDRADENNVHFERVQDEIDMTRIIANDVEAHRRQWAVRLMGVKVLPTKFETSGESKDHILRFITNQLKINTICLDDIDCAHRIGGPKMKIRQFWSVSSIGIT